MHIVFVTPPRRAVSDRRKTFRRSVFVATVLIALHMSKDVQATLCPGQFTGRIRIGTRVILGGIFAATSTAPLGFDNNAALNGTQWNGTDLSGPLDPYGYTISAQSDLPGCDPSDSTLIVYDVQAVEVRTSSGFADSDLTTFAIVTGETVSPQSTAIVDFLEASPWILDVDVTNLGCPTANMNGLEVSAHSGTNGQTSTTSIDSQSTIDGMAHQVRYLDMPLITGSPNAFLNTFTVQVTLNLTGAAATSIPLGPVDVGAGDVDQNGHIHLHFEVSPQCACPDTNLVGTITLNGLAPSDALTSNYVYLDPVYGSRLAHTTSSSYDFGGGIPPGRHHPKLHTDIASGTVYSLLRWPYSGYRDYDGVDPDPNYYTGLDPYEDLACHETGVLNALSDAAFIEGDISYSCKARYESRLVGFGYMQTSGLYEGQNPDGSFIGSWGGAAATKMSATGHYRQILTPGAWSLGQPNVAFDVAPPNGNPEYPEFVSEEMRIYDHRSLVADDHNPTDLRAVHLTAGQTFTRNLNYEMGKVSVSFIITADTSVERELHSPRLVPIGDGIFDDPDTLINPDYVVYADGRGTNEVTEIGKVTLYLPKGAYRYRPYATREIDQSTVAFPEIAVNIRGCIDTCCDAASCPDPQWLPLPDTCGGEIGSVSGTAGDPDGWDHIAYRLNHATPGCDDLAGYTPFTLVPTGGADNEVSFSAPIQLNLGANTVELEAVDGLGRRYREERTVYRTAGAPPTLSLISPADGSMTTEPTSQVQGSVSSSVKIDFVKVNGESVTHAPDSNLPGPNDRSFNHTFVLHPGPNTITVRVCDVCGLCTEEARTVSRPDHACTLTPTYCDDHDVCTTDSCDAITGCAHTSNTNPCDDGDPTTCGDSCGSGLCTGHAVAEPVEVNDTQRAADDKVTFTWDDPPGPYNVYRGGIRPGSGWHYNQGCLTNGTLLQTATDPLVPELGTAFFYLVSRVEECRESVIGRDGLAPPAPGTPDPNPNACPSAGGDLDGDGVLDPFDNCSDAPNSLQEDADEDTHGDICDNCATTYNSGQGDSDQNGIGDACDSF